jgi:hypothetical protein
VRIYLEYNKWSNVWTGDGEEPSADLEDELMKLSRENLKLCEDITAQLQGPSESEPNSLLGSLNILKALRQSSENDTYSAPPPRNATASLKGSRNPKRKAGADASLIISNDDRDSIAADSPAGPSPKVVIPSTNRLKVHSSSRAGSAAPLAAREPSVKIEEGIESGAEQTNKGKWVHYTHYTLANSKQQQSRQHRLFGGLKYFIGPRKQLILVALQTWPTTVKAYYAQSLQ